MQEPILEVYISLVHKVATAFIIFLYIIIASISGYITGLVLSTITPKNLTNKPITSRL